MWLVYSSDGVMDFIQLRQGGKAVCDHTVQRPSAGADGGGGLVAKSYLTLAIPWTVAHQASLSMGFSRQEYWSGLPFPSPGDLPDPGI